MCMFRSSNSFFMCREIKDEGEKKNLHISTNQIPEWRGLECLILLTNEVTADDLSAVMRDNK